MKNKQDKDRNNVVHVTEETRNAAKEYCKRNGISMKNWVSKLVNKAANAQLKRIGMKNCGRSTQGR